MTMLAPNPAPMKQMAAGVIGLERIMKEPYLLDDDLKLVETAGYDGYQVVRKSDNEVLVTICKISGGCDEFDVEADNQGKIKKIEQSHRWYMRHQDEHKQKAFDRYYRDKQDPSTITGRRKSYLTKSLRRQIRDILKRVEFDLPYLDKKIRSVTKVIREHNPKMRDFERIADQETPEQEAESNELHKIVWDTIKTLTDLDQEIARLILDRVRDKKIADALKVPIEDVEWVRRILQEIFK